jgi:hypothetical protein
MILLGLYLEEFNREYLSTPQDRRRLGEALVGFAATVALIIATTFVLLVLP